MSAGLYGNVLHLELKNKGWTRTYFVYTQRDSKKDAKGN